MVTIDEAREVIKQMPNVFDSHDFLRQYTLAYTWPYLVLLKETKDVTNLHMRVGLFLKQNDDELFIRKIDEVETENIFGNPSRCALWEKTEQ